MIQAKKTTLFFFFIFLTGITFSQHRNHHKHHQAKSAGWVKIGTRTVNYGLDKDIIPVGVHEGSFNHLKIVVTGGAVNMHRMTIHYKNGTSETVELKHNFSKNSSTRTIDIKGGNRFIKNIIFIYDTKNLARSKAVMTVFGKH